MNECHIISLTKIERADVLEKLYSQISETVYGGRIPHILSSSQRKHSRYSATGLVILSKLD